RFERTPPAGVPRHKPRAAGPASQLHGGLSLQPCFKLRIEEVFDVEIHAVKLGGSCFHAYNAHSGGARRVHTRRRIFKHDAIARGCLQARGGLQIDVRKRLWTADLESVDRYLEESSQSQTIQHEINVCRLGV